MGEQEQIMAVPRDSFVSERNLDDFISGGHLETSGRSAGSHNERRCVLLASGGGRLGTLLSIFQGPGHRYLRLSCSPKCQSC